MTFLFSAKSIVKKFRRAVLVVILVAALAVGVVAPIAHAQVAPTNNGSTGGGFLNTAAALGGLTVPGFSGTTGGILGAQAGKLAAEKIPEIATMAVFGHTDLKIFILETLANIANTILGVASWFVALAGTLLNVSINITLHIKELVSATPAIYQIWRVMRDITGLFIIFWLLYASIQLILGIVKPNFGNLIKNIVIAGILINFSFFMTGILIDASNVVSLALYRAIVPGQPDIGAMIANGASSGEVGIAAVTNTLFNDGGISSVFMQALKVQNIYDPATIKLSSDPGLITTALKIILFNVTGVMIMVMVALSFLAASIGFIVRLVILIFLLAFSPIWFAAHVVPKIGEYGSRWWGTLTSQLVWMPVYLLLMYAGMMVLTGSSLFGIGAGGGIVAGNAGSWIPKDFIVLCINTVFVILVLNIPLLAAIKLGGSATKFINPKKIGAQGVFGWLGSRTIGAAGLQADKYLAKTRIFGGTTLGRDIAAATTGKLRNSSFGGDVRSAEARRKAGKESLVAKQGINRRREFNKLRGLVGDETQMGRPYTEFKDVIGRMGEKERLALGAKTLQDPNVLRYLKKGDFEAIKKSDDFTETEKADIARTRKETFEGAITGNNPTLVKDMLKNMEPNDVAGLSDNLLRNDTLIEHLTASHLKTIRDSEISADTKRAIAQNIINWQNRNPNEHRAYGYINNNRHEWGLPPQQGGGNQGGGQPYAFQPGDEQFL